MDPHHLASQSNSALLDRMMAGHEDGLALLLLRTQPQLMSHIEPQLQGKLRRHVTVDDVLQETYQQAFRSWRSFQPQHADSFLAWLKRLADHRILDLVKHVTTQKRGGDYRQIMTADHNFTGPARDLITELSSGDATASQLAAKAEAIDAMRVAIAALPNEYQEVIRLKYFEHLSVEDVAQTMGRSSASIRGLLQRAKVQLRTQLHKSVLWLSKKE